VNDLPSSWSRARTDTRYPFYLATNQLLCVLWLSCLVRGILRSGNVSYKTRRGEVVFMRHEASVQIHESDLYKRKEGTSQLGADFEMSFCIWSTEHEIYIFYCWLATFNF